MPPCPLNRAKSVVSALREKKLAAKRNNRFPSNRLVIGLAPCFKSGGFDIYANRDISRLLNAALGCFGLTEPVLVSRGPIRMGQQTGYFYKIFSRVKRDSN